MPRQLRDHPLYGTYLGRLDGNLYYLQVLPPGRERQDAPPGHPDRTHQFHHVAGGSPQRTLSPSRLYALRRETWRYSRPADAAVVAAAALLAQAPTEPDEEWVRSVYARCAHQYRRIGPTGVPFTDTWNAATYTDDPRLGTTTLSRAPADREGQADPEHHNAHFLIRQYFPDYPARLDLMDRPVPPPDDERLAAIGQVQAALAKLVAPGDYWKILAEIERAEKLERVRLDWTVERVRRRLAGKSA